MTTPFSTPAVSGRLYRILAFDGGPYIGAAVRMLRRVADDEPRVLQRADLFAGTSCGSFVALWLACRSEEQLADGPGTLDELIELTDEFVELYSLPAFRPRRIDDIGRSVRALSRSARMLARFASGLRPLGDTDRLTAFLTRRDVFGERKLGELRRHVVSVAFELRSGYRADGPEGNPGAGRTVHSSKDFYRRPWGPRVFHNLAPAEEHPDWLQGDFERAHWGDWSDRDLSLAEVMRRSGALPLWLPIQAGHVDGAVFANNPSMVAAAQVMAFRDWLRRVEAPNGYGRIGRIETRDICVFSLGGQEQEFGGPAENNRMHATARPRLEPKERELRWGWLHWLANARAPGLLVELMLNADGGGVAYQAGHLLTPGLHLRLAASLEGTGWALIRNTFQPARLVETAEDVVEKWASLDETDEKAMAVLHRLAQVLAVGPPGSPEDNGREEQRVAVNEALAKLDGLCRAIAEGSEGTVLDRMRGVLEGEGGLLDVLRRLRETLDEHLAATGGGECGDALHALLRAEVRKAGAVSVELIQARAWLGGVWMAQDPLEMTEKARAVLPHAPVNLWDVLMGDHYRPHIDWLSFEVLAGLGQEESKAYWAAELEKLRADLAERKAARTS